MPHASIIVIGAGVAGQGLAEAIATSGNEVILVDKTTKLAERGIDTLGGDSPEKQENQNTHCRNKHRFNGAKYGATQLLQVA